MLFGLAAVLLSMAAVAANPTSGGAPVTVQNTPLPVVLPNTPVSVSLVQIPEGMDQRTPVSVQIVGTNPNVMFKEKVANLGQVRSGVIGGCQANKSADYHYEDTAECLFPRPPDATGFNLRSVTFTPISADTYLDDAYKAASCRSVLSYSPPDGGTWFQELARATWSPGQYQSVSVELQLPVVIVPNGTFKITTTMFHGKMNQACHAQVWTFGTAN
jgi:hypothetical protein